MYQTVINNIINGIYQWTRGSSFTSPGTSPARYKFTKVHGALRAAVTGATAGVRLSQRSEFTHVTRPM